MGNRGENGNKDQILWEHGNKDNIGEHGTEENEYSMFWENLFQGNN